MSFQARFASPTGDDLRALLRKYDQLAKLRDDRVAGGEIATREELRRLAREFPGALRELDTVAREEIEHRRIVIGAALHGGPVEAWMTWMVAYHAAMRAALFIKARVSRFALAAPDAATIVANGGGAPIDPEDSAPALAPDTARQLAPDTARQLAALASAHVGVPLDESFVEAVLCPPGRRVNAAVFGKLGTEFGLPPESIWETLFPSRRAGRF